MKPFRKNLAIAIDGGGIRGVMVTRALAMLEAELGQPLHAICRLAAGTSTGSIISAGLVSGLSAAKMQELYLELGHSIFKKSWRTLFWPLTRHRYPLKPLEQALHTYLGDAGMSAFWKDLSLSDIVITAFDVLANKTCFIKPWKPEYKDWPLVKAVLASCSVPTYFPPVEGRYVDGGVGSYANPCYLAAYELFFCLGWKPEETTLLSFGTGRDPQAVKPGQPQRFQTWDWISPVLDGILTSANDQQVHLVETFFKDLDFRRFQVDFKSSIPMDDTGHMDELVAYGEQMGHMLLNDVTDRALRLTPGQVRGGR